MQRGCKDKDQCNIDIIDPYKPIKETCFIDLINNYVGNPPAK